MTSYGKNIKIEVFGGSHDSEIGITAKNIPAGITFDMDKLRAFMQRRAPGQSKLTTSRKESDTPVLMSGFDGSTTNGEKIRIIIRNENSRSSDYSSLSSKPRPSHADYPAMVKSGGKADLRGGGHFSGRLTAPICALGGILKEELEKRGIFIGAHIESIGSALDYRFDPIKVNRSDFEDILSHSLPVLDEKAGERMAQVIDGARMQQDSVGGVIECAAVGIPVGVGEHIFFGMESRISSAVFSVPAVKGIEFGAGFASTDMYGSENNDTFYYDGDTVRTRSNNCGGILGGMTDGMPLIFRCAIKPTPSIGLEQDTIDLSTKQNTRIAIEGRHDPCIVPRAVPVIEAMCAIAVFDALLDCGEMEK